MSEVKVNKISPKTACGTVTVGDSGDSVTVSSGVPVTVTDALTANTITVPGNVVKSNALQASDAGNIISQSGTTITLGATGDTVALAAGASQTGFGATYSAISWDTTTIKTTGFTATAGTGYFCNTTSASFTLTLPASPTAGDMIGIKDYLNTFDTNALTIGRNSKPIESETMDAVLQLEGDEALFVFVDDTVGWKIVSHAKKADVAFPTYIVATGGDCVSTCGNYKIHKFTNPGAFCVSSVGNAAGSNSVCYMVVAGGGGGGPSPAGNSGGGGAGGWRGSNGTNGGYAAACGPLQPVLTAPAPSIPVGATPYPITIGAGGGTPGGGSNSSAFPITSTGGCQGNPSTGGSGGSGGGASGPGNNPPTDPPQGNNGGGGPGGGGGGGIGGAGASYGSAGNGLLSCITGSPVGYAGGSQGGGARWSPPWGVQPNSKTGIGTAGAANSGAGGSGGAGSPAPSTSGSGGGSGIVVIRYKYQ